MSLDPDGVGVGLIMVSLGSVIVLGGGHVVLSGFWFDLLAGAWLLFALGFVMLAGAPQ